MSIPKEYSSTKYLLFLAIFLTIFNLALIHSLKSQEQNQPIEDSAYIKNILPESIQNIEDFIKKDLIQKIDYLTELIKNKKIKKNKISENLIAYLRGKITTNEEKKKFINFLTYLGNKKYIKFVASFLNDENTEIKLIAFYSIKSLKKEKFKKIPKQSAGKKEKEYDIEEKIQTEPFKFIDSKLVDEIKEVEAKKDTERIRNYLKHENHWIRIKALSILANLGVKEAKNEIISLLSDKEPLVRSTAIWSLKKLQLKDTAINIMPLLHDASPEVRSEAVSAMGAFKYEKAIPNLVNLLNDQDVIVKIRSAQALTNLGTKDALHIITLLEDTHKEIREFVITSLRKLSEQKLKPETTELTGIFSKIFNLLKSTDNQVVVGAILALVIYNPGKVIAKNSLQPLLKNKSLEVQKEVQRAIIKLKIKDFYKK